MNSLQNKILNDLNNAPNSPCGCPECDNGVQQGHFACSQSVAILVQAEREGLLARHYNGTSWVWERTNKRLPSEKTIEHLHAERYGRY